MIPGLRPGMVWMGAGAYWARLQERAAAGDAEAWEEIRQILPAKIPGAARQLMRNARLRRLAAMVRQAWPGEARTGVSEFIAKAGARIEGGRQLTGPPFAELGDVLEAFTATIMDTLTLLDPDPRTGARWPCERTIRDVIS